jgi:hypothetical protein
MDEQTTNDALAYLEQWPEVLDPARGFYANRVPLWIVLTLYDEVGRSDAELNSQDAVIADLKEEIRGLKEDLAALEEELYTPPDSSPPPWKEDE